MKINIKIKSADYDKETGISKTEISTDIGIFTGYAKLSPDDKEIESNYAGCRYAEMRATMKYMLEKARLTKIRLQPLYKIDKELSTRKYLNTDDICYKTLQKEIYLLEDEKEFYIQSANSLKVRLDATMQAREKIIEDIINKRQKEQ